MLVSEHFGLALAQSSLEFVNVDISEDTPLFIDPHALADLASDWAEECRLLIQSFFEQLMEAVRNNDRKEAERLLSKLSEPSNTRLGFSHQSVRGSGVGGGLGGDLLDVLMASTAVQEGLLQDLEETALLVPQIGADRLSDVTTNIIRRPLIEFTQRCCERHGIVLTPDVVSGPYWDGEDWQNSFVELPVFEGGLPPLILVPKVIVRKPGDFNFEKKEFYDDFILPFLEDREIAKGMAGGLVRIIKSTRQVKPLRTKIRETYGEGKEDIARLTLQNPELLDRYRQRRRANRKPPMTNERIAAAVGDHPTDWDGLLEAVTSVATGAAAANAYHMAVWNLFEALFSPDLDFGVKELEINSGRKRIDLRFTNIAHDGSDRNPSFFAWLPRVVACPYALVEVKNYSRELKNPELDQLIGRFSSKWGKFGIIVCRELEDKETFLLRCADAVNNGQGLPLLLDDEDLAALTALRKSEDEARVNEDWSGLDTARREFFLFLQGRVSIILGMEE